MLITTLKRFEFSASHTHADQPRLHGHNFILWVGVRGPVDAANGMVINVTDLKAQVNRVLDARYDHHNLNVQLAGDSLPTPAVAEHLWHDLAPHFTGVVNLQALSLQEECGDGAQVWGGETHAVQWGAFSAAHRTYAPALTEAENWARYGQCSHPMGHGHNYRVALQRPPQAVPRAVWRDLDHVNLNTETPALRGRNVTTEALARLLAERAQPAHRARVWELPDFFADYRPADDSYALGRRYHFNAAHRLHSPSLSPADNAQVYGKCNRAETHGHTYRVEVVVQAPLDPRTETAFDLLTLDQAVQPILHELHNTLLDDLPAFARQPSTGENIAAHLWHSLRVPLGNALAHVQVWETPNNAFIAHREHDRYSPFLAQEIRPC